MSQAFIMYTNTDYNIHGATTLLFISPCWFPFAPLSNPLYLLGNPPSCDRIRPPWSQVACKLTSPFSTLFPITPPSKFPEPVISSASLWRPQEFGISCPEQLDRKTAVFIIFRDSCIQTIQSYCRVPESDAVYTLTASPVFQCERLRLRFRRL